MEPKVSVIIPVYNDADHIGRAIDSVRAQTYSNIEILVIDDGSDDEGRTLRALAAYRNDATVIPTDHVGVAHARNTGLRNATGEYYAFLDSDDLFYPEKIEKQVKYMEENELNFSSTSYNRLDMAGNFIEYRSTAQEFGRRFPDVISSCAIATPTVMVRADAMQDLRFPETFHIGEDVCLWIDLAYRYEFGHIDVPLTGVCTDEESSAAYNPFARWVGFINLLAYTVNNENYRREKIAINRLLRKTFFPERYRFNSKMEMYLHMALEGNSLRVPAALTTWRRHGGQIPNRCDLVISEIEDWYQRYFAKSDLPDDMKACRADCRKAITQYEWQLIANADISDGEKKTAFYALEKRIALDGRRYINLQVGNDDLVGNKFNGHDLHVLLQQQGVQSFHCVARKRSGDEKTFVIKTGVYANFAKQLLSCKQFLLSDVVHFHLIHQTDFDISLLPLLSHIKPVVMTMHDPFFTTGHCIHSGECEKWKTFCTDCERLDWQIPLLEDTASLHFMEKQLAFQNADISLIVASEWMRQRAEASPILQGKKTYLLPFGVNQTLFTAGDTSAAKQALGIDPSSIALMFRADKTWFKGLNIVCEALRMLDCNKKVVLITVKERGLLNAFADRYDLHEYGWVTDDAKLVQLYQACDIFLMPSLAETFGMMAIEAMSCGKPVLAIAGTALPEVIHSPECGLAVEQQEYVSALQRLIDDDTERLTRGEKSLAYARERYSIERYIQGMLAIYDDVMARFAHSEQKDAVARQLLCLLPPASDASAVSELYKTRSWKFTRPLRAFTNAARQRIGLTGKVKLFFDYLRDPKGDMQSDFFIVNSKSWKITAPFRALADIFTHGGNRR